MIRFDPLDQLEAAATLEREIDDGQIGFHLVNELTGRGDVLRRAADLEVRLAQDQQREALPHDGVIVNDQHSGGPRAGVRLFPSHGDRPR